MKICSKCKIEKELSEFGKQSDKKDGLKYQCKVCVKEQNIKKYDKNKYKKYYLENKERLKIVRDKYNKENKVKIRIIRRNYSRNRYKVDYLFRIRKNIGSLVRNSIKLCGYNKTSKTQNILGCSFEDFKTHIEEQFEPWMSWDNYGNPKDGILELNKSWDIDHIIPVSSAESEEELIKLNHYTNLQPLCSYNNRVIKKNNIWKTKKY